SRESARALFAPHASRGRVQKHQPPAQSPLPLAGELPDSCRGAAAPFLLLPAAKPRPIRPRRSRALSARGEAAPSSRTIGFLCLLHPLRWPPQLPTSHPPPLIFRAVGRLTPCPENGGRRREVERWGGQRSGCGQAEEADDDERKTEQEHRPRPRRASLSRGPRRAPHPKPG